MRQNRLFKKYLLPGLLLILVMGRLTDRLSGAEDAFPQVTRFVQDIMAGARIPGLAVIVVKDGLTYVRGFGYADLERQIPVGPDTRFELASCSKAFTALAALQLEQRGLLRLENPVSHYFPWFTVRKDGENRPVTLRQLLHHTSGIPWRTIAEIPMGNGEDALEETVRNISGVELDHLPGEKFVYATVNYDIVGAVIEKVTGKRYEDYMREYIFRPLALSGTYVEMGEADSRKANGYKIGFLKPRPYRPPLFRGNNPAAYVVSNADDMARWLKIQLGLIPSDLTPLIRRTHRRDSSVPPDRSRISSYAMGWHVSLRGGGSISHSGANPNFSAYVGLNPSSRTGVAVLANSNSGTTPLIGKHILKSVSGEKTAEIKPSGDKIDLTCSIFSLILAAYILLTLLMITLKISGFIRGKNQYEPLTWKKAGKLVIAAAAVSPYVIAVYLLPKAALNVDWQVVLVWAPVSAFAAVLLLMAAFALSFIKFFLSLLLPHKNKYLNAIPFIVLLGMLSGLANTLVLFLITTSFYSPMSLGYLLFYFALAYALFAVGNKIVATKMIRMTNNITLDLRIDLINKIMSSQYENFEGLHDGRIFTTLNGDTAVLAGSANMVIGGITHSITAISAFVYLATISFSATLVVAAVMILLGGYYYWISQISRRYLEEARDTQNVYMSLLNSLIKGYKELSLHFRKKKEYREDLLDSCIKFREKSVAAAIKFLNSNIIGNSFIMIILGVISIVVPRVLVDINTLTLISFIMVLLYVIGPINGLLHLIPGVTKLKVSWDRIKSFINDLNLQIGNESVEELIRKLNAADPADRLRFDDHRQQEKVTAVESLKVEGLIFKYESGDEDEEGFALGPIDLEVRRGEILFIVGGNGSGKTTLAKLLTGLYLPRQGRITVNGRAMNDGQLGEYYSTVFSDYHLFKKIYEVNTGVKQTEIQHYLRLFSLAGKVSVQENEYSTLNLSGGQKKRVALIQCFLEDSPIYLFDELAANQDPEFRKFFYRELLLKMKEDGKIVIAITHDDNYFDVADKIIKLSLGQIGPPDKSLPTGKQ